LDVAFLNADLNQARLFWEYFKAFDWGDNMQKYAFERTVNVYPEKYESSAKPVHSHLSIIEPISLDSVIESDAASLFDHGETVPLAHVVR
jgi:hypothetical protein